MKTISTISTSAMLALFSAVSSAATTNPNPVPEPGSFALLAIGVGAAAVVWMRGRKK